MDAFSDLSVLLSIILGRLPTGANLAFHFFLLGVCGLAVTVRRPRLHETLAVVNAVAVIVYIAALFSRLR